MQGHAVVGGRGLEAVLQPELQLPETDRVGIAAEVVIVGVVAHQVFFFHSEKIVGAFFPDDFREGPDVVDTREALFIEVRYRLLVGEEIAAAKLILQGRYLCD